MKLKIEYLNEDTGEKLIVKNDGEKVFYHYSEFHDPKEFGQLTGAIIKIGARERLIINAFYKLASEI